MIKHIFIALTCLASLKALENSVSVINTNENAPIIGEEITASESINLIIKDLEKAITLMDSPQRFLITDNLNTVNETAHNLVIKLMALMKINKLANLGVESAQVYEPFHTYNRFKTKFTQVSAEISALKQTNN